MNENKNETNVFGLIRDAIFLRNEIFLFINKNYSDKIILIASKYFPPCAKNAYTIEDIAIDVIEKITIRHHIIPIDNMDSLDDFRNYVLKTAVNHCLNLKKREDRIERRNESTNEMIDQGCKIINMHQEDDLINKIDYETYLGVLTTEEQIILRLRLEGFTFREIMEMRGKNSPQAVIMSYKRILVKLKQEFGSSLDQLFNKTIRS